MSNFFLIIADDIDEYQRTLIHEEVKRLSGEWWHQHPDVWISDFGTSARDWSTRLSVVVPHSPSMLLVLRLPGEGDRSWSGRGPTYKWAWLRKNYAVPSGAEPDPDFEIPAPPKPKAPPDPV